MIASYITTCQCGSAQYEIVAPSRTAVTLRCARCGLRASVKGNVAPVRVAEAEIAAALHAVVRPSPQLPAEPPAMAADALRPRTLRFQIFPDQDPIIQQAMEICRIQHLADPGMRTQVWQGTALELICADYLAGVDPRAAAVYDAMQTAVAAAEVARGPLPARSRRDLWARTRDAAIERLVGSPPAPQDDPSGAEAMIPVIKPVGPPATMLPGDHRLPEHIALETVITRYGHLHPEAHCCVADLATLRRRAQRGGFVLRLLGDARTCTAAGQRPAVLLHLTDLTHVEGMQDLYDDVWNRDLEAPQLTVTDVPLEESSCTP